MLEDESLPSEQTCTEFFRQGDVQFNTFFASEK
jgi:hypothetical protein